MIDIFSSWNKALVEIYNMYKIYVSLQASFRTNFMHPKMMEGM